MSATVAPYCLRHELGDVIKERYKVRSVLGAGAFGTVYLVEETLGARTLTLACKEMHVLSDPATNADERADALRMFQEEAYLLQTLRHPHIPAAYFEPEKGVWLACPICGRTFKGARVCPDHGAELEVVRERYYLMMDFIEGPDLEEMLVENGERPLDETVVLDYTLQVCDAWPPCTLKA
jgi:serine/threonine protein kinase